MNQKKLISLYKRETRTTTKEEEVKNKRCCSKSSLLRFFELLINNFFYLCEHYQARRYPTDGWIDGWMDSRQREHHQHPWHGMASSSSSLPLGTIHLQRHHHQQQQQQPQHQPHVSSLCVLMVEHSLTRVVAFRAGFLHTFILLPMFCYSTTRLIFVRHV